MIESVSIWRRFDYILFAATLVLVVFGILMIASATQDAIDDDIIQRVPDQVNFAIIGFIVAIIMASIDYRSAGQPEPLAVCRHRSTASYGSVLWRGRRGRRQTLAEYRHSRIQPSEIGKILLIITLSQYIAERYLDLGKLTTVFRTMIHVAIPAALIFSQPDSGHNPRISW